MGDTGQLAICLPWRIRGGGRRTPIRSWLKWLVALVAALSTLLIGGVPAATAIQPGKYQFLGLSQSVGGVQGSDPAALKAGDSFTLRFNLSCSERNCPGVKLEDQFPAQFKDFGITDVSVDSSLNSTVVWSEGGTPLDARPQKVGNATKLTVTPRQSFDGGTGLAVGQSSVSVTLKVPDDFTPDDPRNNQTIENLANLSAPNSATASSASSIIVHVLESLSANINASFNPQNGTYGSDGNVALILSVRGGANGRITSLVVSEPQGSKTPNGTSKLDESNPFRFFDFEGFDSMNRLPSGADTVRVDAYVYTAGSWNWKQGRDSADFMLPDGVRASQVAGLRFTFKGDMAKDVSIPQFVINLKQRGDDRNDDAHTPLTQSKTSVTINNTVSVQASKGNKTGDVSSANASFTLSPPSISVDSTQLFNGTDTNPSYPAGNRFTDVISVSNMGTNVHKLIISSKQGFFDKDIKFGGFSPIILPQGAHSGKVTYHMLDGTADQVRTFGDSSVPANPTGDISGFDVEFDGGAGTIDPIEHGAHTTVNFTVKTSSDMTFPNGGTAKNSVSTVVTKVVTHNGLEASKELSSGVTLVKPVIELNVVKKVSPTQSVSPGASVIAQLKAGISSKTYALKPNKITVEDSWQPKKLDANGNVVNNDEAGDKSRNFWNAFDIKSIQPTPLPQNTSLDVQVQVNGRWVVLDHVPAKGNSSLYRLSAEDLRRKLHDACGAVPSDVTGIRFVFDSGNNSPFDAMKALDQFVAFTERSTRRDGTNAPGSNTDEIDKIDDKGQIPTPYQIGNSTVLNAEGVTDDGKVVSVSKLDADSSGRHIDVIKYPTKDDVKHGFLKMDGWANIKYTSHDVPVESIYAQSDMEVSSHLMWGVDPDMSYARVTDRDDTFEYVSNDDTFAGTWGPNFNLMSISGINTSSTPYDNGWYLKYDTISKIEVQTTRDNWIELPKPNGSWQDQDGSFKGYVIPETFPNSTVKREDITGVRFMVVPNDAARSRDSTNPYVPAPGSGVTPSAAVREFVLNWNIRVKERDCTRHDCFVTGHSTDASGQALGANALQTAPRGLADASEGTLGTQSAGLPKPKGALVGFSSPSPFARSGSQAATRVVKQTLEVYSKSLTVHSPGQGDLQEYQGAGQADFNIQDGTPNVDATGDSSSSTDPPSDSNTANKPPVVVPPYGAVSQGDYPNLNYRLQAKSSSPSRASYIRVIEPAMCSDTNIPACALPPTDFDQAHAAAVKNPFDRNTVDDIKNGKLDSFEIPNIFNKQDLTRISISADIPSEVSLEQSVVWLLRYTPGVDGAHRYSFTKTTAQDANAMTEEQLSDVVGVSVTFQGTDPEQDGGTITSGNNLHVDLSTRVRSTLRADGSKFVPKSDGSQTSGKNRVFAQVLDPITGGGRWPSSSVAMNRTYISGSVKTKAASNIDPSVVNETKPDSPLTVSLQGRADSCSGQNVGDACSTLSPTKVTMTDWPEDQGLANDTGEVAQKTSGFWKNHDFTGLKTIDFPSGASRVKVSAYGPFGVNGAMQWQDGDWQLLNTASNSGYAMPVANSRFSDVQGLRFTFDNPDANGNAQLFSSTRNDWRAGVTYGAKQRSTVRGTSQAVSFKPTDATDTVLLSVQVESKTSELSSSASDTAVASVKRSQGSADLGLSEFANNGASTATIGQMVPWDIYVSNRASSTAYISLDDITLDLPDQLVYTGFGATVGDPAMTFEPDSSHTGGVTTVPSLDTSTAGKIKLTWPAGKSRMNPGEQLRIRIWLELQPGARSGQQITLPVKVHTDKQPVGLYAISVDGMPSPSSPVALSGAERGAKTSANVLPSYGENIYALKGVRGALDGAVSFTDPSAKCDVTFTGKDGRKYYRSPCEANTAIGGIDDWVLHMVNAGTVPLQRAQFFEELPQKGDKMMVASGENRGSTYRPELTGAPKVLGVPAGAATIEATTSASPCVGTWPSLLNGVSQVPDACSTDPSVSWMPSASVADWSKVTGIRVTVDFSRTGGELSPGDGVDVTYSSKNVAGSAEGNASMDAKAGPQEAKGQFGLYYTNMSGSSTPLAPVPVGVHISTGSLEIAKEVNGLAKGYAPAHVVADVDCRNAQGQNVLFGTKETGSVTISKGDDGNYVAGRLSGIPLSAGQQATSCTVSEHGPLGQFGETERSVSVDNVATNVVALSHADGVDSNGKPSTDVDHTQKVLITNTYRYAGMKVRKKVDTKADKGQFGPFDFTLSCATKDGQAVRFAGRNDTSFTLTDGGVWSAPADTIPAGSTCLLKETGTSAADSTVFTGTNVTGHSDGTASITLNDSDTDVVSTLVTNHYDAGTLQIRREVTGDGAPRYGKAKMRFSAVCDYRGQHLLAAKDGLFSLRNGETESFGIFPAGTQCVVNQLDDSGATEHRLTPTNGTVTINRLNELPGGQSGKDGLSHAEVLAQDRYDIGTLRVVLKRTGDRSAIAARGAGPFRVRLDCAHQKNSPSDEELPGKGEVILDAAHDYQTTIGEFIVGTGCHVTQTDTSMADLVSYNPQDGNAVIPDDDITTVEIIDQFNARPNMASTGTAIAALVTAVVILFGAGGVLMISRRRHEASGSHLAAGHAKR